MIVARPHVLSLALVACEPGLPPDAAGPELAEPAPGARAAIRSCPVGGEPVHVHFEPRLELGEAGGVTWLYGQSGGDAVLAHLAASGSLVFHPVPLLDAQAGAVDGTRLWLYAPGAAAGVPARWAAVDVTDPERPISGDVAALSLGARSDVAAALAVGARRAVVVVGAPEDRELVLLDTATRTAVGPAHALGAGLEPVHAVCDDDHCAVVATTDAKGGPGRRLVVIRVLADGAREQEALAPDWVGRAAAATRDDQVIVAWPDLTGLKLRALDRGGRPIGPAVPVPADRSAWNLDSALLHADGSVMLAIHEHGGWSVAPVGPHILPGPRRALPGADRRELRGAPLDDGLAWINLDGVLAPAVDEEGAGVMLHSRSALAFGGFLPITDEPNLSIDLGNYGCGGAGGFEAHVLTRPGAAGALLVPRGDAVEANETVFALLRTVCL
jgi:hypothetical protein